MHAPEIVVSPARELIRRRRLFDAVAELYGVRFVADDAQRPASKALVAFSATRADAVAWAKRGTKCLAFLRDADRASAAHSSDVVFSRSSHLSPLFRGMSLADNGIGSLIGIEREPEDEIIAERAGEPVWTHWEQQGCAADLVATPPPVLGETDYLFEHFRQDNCASLLPLLHFVAEVSGWKAPPLRACFMFDDPNLHWRSYGYVKYREIAEAAKAENYHASFATVPMDAWFVHAPTAGVFRDNPNFLSLLMHGNDHTLLELLKPPKATAIALAAQALDRITRLERKSGLSVARVMAAPHGACSEASARALLKTGFDAACISRGSLMSRNPDVSWRASVGMHPAEFFGGLPVIPRVDITLKSDVPARLAGFLGQPIIPVGHHDDLRAGLSVLSGSASFINSIGAVRWTDMQSVSELNYSSRVLGSVLEVRMYSRRVRITVPSGVTQVSIQRPWLSQDAREGLLLQTAGDGDVSYTGYQGEPLEVIEGDSVVRSVDAEPIDLKRVRFPHPSIHAVLRRQLCEVRDRLRPTVDRIMGLSST